MSEGWTQRSARLGRIATLFGFSCIAFTSFAAWAAPPIPGDNGTYSEITSKNAAGRPIYGGATAIVEDNNSVDYPKKVTLTAPGLIQQELYLRKTGYLYRYNAQARRYERDTNYIKWNYTANPKILYIKYQEPLLDMREVIVIGDGRRGRVILNPNYGMPIGFREKTYKLYLEERPGGARVSSSSQRRTPFRAPVDGMLGIKQLPQASGGTDGGEPLCPDVDGALNIGQLALAFGLSYGDLDEASCLVNLPVSGPVGGPDGQEPNPDEPDADVSELTGQDDCRWQIVEFQPICLADL